MTPVRTYFDHNATTPIHLVVRQAMMDALDHVGNPSSIHAEGRAARGLVEAARREVALLTGAVADDIVFTSGGTEALNAILTPDFGRCDVLLIGAGEHSAVWAGHRFEAARVETVGLTPQGKLDLADLAVALHHNVGRRAMLALQAANNETGVIQPVAEAAKLIHDHGGVVVCDAVQAAGKIACRLDIFGADALVLSAHKFGGPKGVGALIFAPGAPHLKLGLVRGGGQERGLRSGTENVSGIAGLGAAAGLLNQLGLGSVSPLATWRDAVEKVVLAHAPDAVIFGRDVERLPNTLNFAVPGFEAQVLLMNLDLAGVAVSPGSACSSGKVKPSHVLRAMGVADDIAAGAVRVSLGWTTKQDDVAAFEAAFAKALRMMRPRKAA